MYDLEQTGKAQLALKLSGAIPNPVSEDLAGLMPKQDESATNDRGTPGSSGPEWSPTRASL